MRLAEYAFGILHDLAKSTPNALLASGGRELRFPTNSGFVAIRRSLLQDFEIRFQSPPTIYEIGCTFMSRAGACSYKKRHNELRDYKRIVAN